MPQPPGLTRRAFLAGTLSLLGCGGGKKGGGTGPTPLGDPTEPITPSPIGYSHVLHLDGPRAREVVAAGGTLVQAEPWTGSTEADWRSQQIQPGGQPDREPNLALTRAAADVMRGTPTGQLILTAHNMNVVRPTDTEYETRLNDVIRTVGVPRVLLEPVGNGGDTRLEAVARRVWPGTIISTVHPCSSGAVLASLRPGVWTVTDCGVTLANWQPEATIKAWVRGAIERRAPLLLYMTFVDHPWSRQVVAWMQEALRG